MVVPGRKPEEARSAITFHTNVDIAFSTFSAGNMRFGLSDPRDKKNDRSVVLGNRRRLFRELGFDGSRVAWMATRMAGMVHCVVSKDLGSGRLSHEDGVPCDAIFSDIPGSVVGLLPADCAPVMVFHKSALWGIVHAGRPNAHVVIENSIEWLVRQGIKLENVTAILGPTIRPLTYFFPNGKEAYIAEQLHDESWKQFITAESGGHRVDLPGYVRSLLLAGGILPGHFVDLGLDTADGFFSNALKNKRGIDGRHASLIGQM